MAKSASLVTSLNHSSTFSPTCSLRNDIDPRSAPKCLWPFMVTLIAVLLLLLLLLLSSSLLLLLLLLLLLHDREWPHLPGWGFSVKWPRWLGCHVKLTNLIFVAFSQGTEISVSKRQTEPARVKFRP